MALPDLTGINIQESYQRLLQTDGTQFFDGTGSLVDLGGSSTFPYTGDAVINGTLNVTTNFTASGLNYPSTDGDDGQVLTTDGLGNLTFAFPKSISEPVKNVSGDILYKGTPVYVTGSAGNTAKIVAANALTKYPAHFVLNEDLADEAEGQAIALGFINNVDVADASIYTEGQNVYLGASGGWVTTKPTGSAQIQKIGVILKVNTSGNKISGIIQGAGRVNDIPNLPTGYTWVGDGNGVAIPTPTSSIGGSSGTTFPYSGSAEITGSLKVIGPLTITGSQLITDDITSSGTLRARVKSFDIEHPTKLGKRLVYGALEGPEHGVYCRGRANELKVKLPPEWSKLIVPSTITVQITSAGKFQPIYFEKFISNWLYFGCDSDITEYDFFWEIKGARADVPKLKTTQ